MADYLLTYMEVAYPQQPESQQTSVAIYEALAVFALHRACLAYLASWPLWVFPNVTVRYGLELTFIFFVPLVVVYPTLVAG